MIFSRMEGFESHYASSQSIERDFFGVFFGSESTPNVI